MPTSGFMGFWNITNLDKKPTALPKLNLNNEYTETSTEKANMLNNYFSTQATVDDTNKCPHPLVNFKHVNLETITMTIKDVNDVLENLDISKVNGSDLLSPRFLKEDVHVLSKPISFNRPLQQGYFSSSLKDANVTPIH